MSAFPIFSANDVERAAAFYERALGFERKYQWPTEGDAEFAYLRRGDDGLGIGRGEPGDGYLLCVYVDDVDAKARELRALGSSELEPPADQPWGERMAQLISPDGHRLLLTMKL